MAKKSRPINLKLSSLHYPPMAIVSILHRLSGIALFLLFPFILYLLSLSLHSQFTFFECQRMLSSLGYKFLLWLLGSALIYHTLAGFRHIIMDMGYSEELHTARMGALLVLFLSFILAMILGIWIW